MSLFEPNKVLIAQLFQAATLKAFPQLAADAHFTIEVEKPKNPDHGHFAVNSALQLAKVLKLKPRDVAEGILAALPAIDADSILAQMPEIAGPGFINIRLSAHAQTRVIGAIAAAGDSFGKSAVGANEPVMVEFVSANPTGPLHVGHGRAAAVGDTLARLLEWQGYKVAREFYYNDAGVQIENLTLSVQARLRERLLAAGQAAAPFPEKGYHGEYICDIAANYAARYPNDLTGSNAEQVRAFAVAALRHEQDMDLQAFAVSFDQYYLESSLYGDGLVDKTVAALKASGHTYEQDGATFLRTTTFGDDKDRVMQKSDGTYTYFLPDVAYHVTKWQRGFKRAITELGADHHGTLARVRAGLQAMNLGIAKGYPDYVLHQMITVMREGVEVKLGKRAGGYITLRDLIDEVGRDATRYFFVMRKSDSQLNFDIDLAKSKSEENPVYYVQYAHARICRVQELFAQSGGDAMQWKTANLARLQAPVESDLLRLLAEFPEQLAIAARELAPHLVAVYLSEVAAKLHSYYNAEKFLVDDTELKLARLALIAATKQVLRNGLDCLGVSAPEKM
jgi:arginyl-tRNA synthetase